MRTDSQTGRRTDRGWLVLGLLLLLAVAATLALAVGAVWVRRYDRATRKAEEQVLAEMRTSLTRHVMDVGSIPAPAEVLPAVSARSGRSLAQLLGNVRGGGRVVIADPNLRLGPVGIGGLPYAQGQLGSALPQSPRLVILSSLGHPLPTNLVTGGVLTTAQFNSFWNCAQGQRPSGLAWDGDPDDLLVQRVHLEDLFAKVTLQYYSAAAVDQGKYVVSSESANAGSPAALISSPFSAYYLRGTYLALYGPNGALQFRDVLQESDLVYTCQNGIWRRGQGNRGSRVGPVVRHPTPEEFADALEFFLMDEVTLWPNNTTASKQDMLLAITNFLAVGAYNNQGASMATAQSTLINRWVSFTGAQPNKP